MAGTRPGWSQPAARGTGGTPAPVAWTVLFGDDAVADGPYVLDRHLDDVTGLHPDRRGPGESNSAGRAGGDHVAGGQAGKEEKNSTAAGTLTSICEVRADCITVPLSVELMARSLASTSSVVTTSGPIGMLPTKFLPAVHWVAARCQSRQEASLTTTKPAIASRAFSARMYRKRPWTRS